MTDFTFLNSSSYILQLACIKRPEEQEKLQNHRLSNIIKCLQNHELRVQL